MPLLDIRHLTIEFKTNEGWVKAVDRVSLTLTEGEIRGLVGESGSGKSLIAKAICGVTKDNWRVTADRMRFDDIDLLRLSNRERRKLIGHNVSMIFQEPQSCLDPSERIGQQLIQSIPGWTYKGRWWQRLGWRKRRAIELLHRVGIKDHKDAMRSFPYQLTEGECQKVMIAIALAGKPKLLIADEPTTALDVTIQAQVLAMIANLRERLGTSMLMITHDLGVVAKTCDNVCIMYAGKIVEAGTIEDVFSGMKHHPYTEGLFASIPNIKTKSSRLKPIKGLMPDPTNLPQGCAFYPRCEKCMDVCKTIPPGAYHNGTHSIFCHQYANQAGSVEGKGGAPNE